MLPRIPALLRRTAFATAAVAAILIGAPQAHAKVTKIVIDSPANWPNSHVLLAADKTYETITGRAFGELDPKDSHNLLITDIGNPKAKSANGKVEYVASFFIVKPLDMSKASGLMWHDVPNRGGRITISSDLRAQGDIGLSSGWQGDNAGATAVPATWASTSPVTPSANEWVRTPVLTGVTGRILGRIINRSGTNQPLNVMGNPIPYFPANSADNSDAVLKVHTHETLTGIVTEGETIPNSDWKFCYGATATFAAPGAPVSGAPNNLPVRVCLGNGRTFDPAKLYQLVYTVKDPYVLGAGTAAFRDVESFFRYEIADSQVPPTPNPIANAIKWAILRGSSQSGNFTRHLIFLGMNADESGRIVHEGAWPLIAGRRVSNNSRWGQPDGVLELYQMGSEGPQWWHSFPDRARNLA